MIDHPDYQASQNEAMTFLAGRALGRLVTRDRDGTPEIGLYPFICLGDAVELHLVRDDSQARSLRAHQECSFQVDEVLSFIPSYWEHPENAQGADHYYRFVSCRGRADLIADPVPLAAHLSRLLSRYQPEGRYRGVTEAEPLYRAGLRRLVLVRITVEAITTKFKLGQQQPAATRRRIVDFLRARRLGTDIVTAGLVEAMLDRVVQ